MPLFKVVIYKTEYKYAEIEVEAKDEEDIEQNLYDLYDIKDEDYKIADAETNINEIIKLED
jgi:hypothetical protein